MENRTESVAFSLPQWFVPNRLFFLSSYYCWCLLALARLDIYSICKSLGLCRSLLLYYCHHLDTTFLLRTHFVLPTDWQEPENNLPKMLLRFVPFSSNRFFSHTGGVLLPSGHTGGNRHHHPTWETDRPRALFDCDKIFAGDQLKFRLPFGLAADVRKIRHQLRKSMQNLKLYYSTVSLILRKIIGYCRATTGRLG